MSVLAASIGKEARVLLRDREGLAILFLMPLVFVVIMSLALQDFFRPGDAARFSFVVLDYHRSIDAGPATANLGGRIAAGLRDIPGLRVKHVTADASADTEPRDATSIVKAVQRGEVQFALIIPGDANDRLSAVLRERDPRRRLVPQREVPTDAADRKDASARIELALMADPGLRADQRALVRTALERVLLGVEIEQTVRLLSGSSGSRTSAAGSSTSGPAAGGDSTRGVLHLREASSDSATMPSSTQQNVPAYSLLAIFMLVVPLSTTFIKERDQGTLLRLRTLPVPATTLIAAKVVPYFVVNLVQMAFCLAIGRWLIPVFGGEALTLTGAMLGPVALLSCAVSLAAIGFALLIAMIARTPEQATAFGAAAVLLMAAIGGIMVPKLLMPEMLQRAALASPMGWALDGFIAIFLRNAGLADVLLTAGALLLFALACLGLALRRFGAMMRAA